MANEVVTSQSSSSGWHAKQVYALAAVCLLIGLAVGYLFRGSRSPAPPAPAAMQAAGGPGGSPHAAMGGQGGQPPTLEQMKQMADKKAEPLLAKLKDDPKNANLLVQVGNIYFATHQFKEAAEYLAKSLEVNPKNVAIRTELASCLYYAGDVDGALQQLTQATTDDPKDANSLFNLGMIRWQGKKDTKGVLIGLGATAEVQSEVGPGQEGPGRETDGRRPPGNHLKLRSGYRPRGRANLEAVLSGVEDTPVPVK